MDIKNTDLYALLGLKKEDNPTQDQIKKAFRKASIKWHPDRWADASKEEQEEAQDKFQAINYANQILSDEKKKRIYDTTGNAEQADKGQEGFDPFSMFTGGAGGFSFNFGGDDFDIGEMFGFGSRRAGQAQARVVPGQDLQVRIKISLDELLGNMREHHLRIRRDVRCPVCHGSGGDSKICPHCRNGVITEVKRDGYSVVQQTRPCPHCHGTGRIITKPCTKCNGTGFEKKEFEKTIIFAEGTRDGEYIVYQNEGSESKSPSGPSGRLIAIAQYDYDKTIFSINGADITEKVSVNYEDCILGTKLTHTLPGNKEVNITLSKLTPPGKKIVLRGKGLKLHDDYGNMIVGDYYIEVVYTLPSTLSSQEEDALKSIKDTRK